MTEVPGGDAQALGLVMRAGSALCFMPTKQVREIMRPRPIEAFKHAPPFVLGVSVIRGAAVPVVDLGGLLGLVAVTAPQRFVSLDMAGRAVALAVSQVIGVRRLQVAQHASLPPLLGGARPDTLDAIDTLDAELLVVLQGAKVVPDEVWRELGFRPEAS